MSASSPTSRTSRKHRNRNSNSKVEPTNSESTEMQDVVTENETNTSALAVHSDTQAGLAHASDRKYTVLANHRPIYPSTFHHLDHTFLPNNRPIATASLVVNETFGENRPVVVSEHRFVESSIIPFNRPVEASEFPSTEFSPLPNHRPIASNEAKGVAAVMGYLD